MVLELKVRQIGNSMGFELAAAYAFGIVKNCGR